MAGAAMDSDAEAFEGLGQAYGEEIFEDAEQVQLGSTSEREQDPPYENPGVDAGHGDGRQPGPGVQAMPRVARMDDLSPGNSELSRMEKGAPVPSWAGAVTQAMQEEPELVPAEPGRSLIGAGGLGGNIGASGSGYDDQSDHAATGGAFGGRASRHLRKDRALGTVAGKRQPSDGGGHPAASTNFPEH